MLKEFLKKFTNVEKTNTANKKFERLWKEQPADFVRVAKQIDTHGCTIHGDDVIALSSETGAVEFFEFDPKTGEWDQTVFIPPKNFIRDVVLG